MKKSFKTSTKNALLSGPNIYRDKHGNAIYYNKRTNIAYKISPDKEYTFQTLQLRIVLDAIAFILFYILFKLSLVLSIGLTVVIGTFLEYRYRSFLKRVPQSVGFTKLDKAKPIDQMIDTPINGLILRATLYALLSVLLVINSFTSNNVSGNIPLEVASYVIAVFGVFMAFKYISLIIRKSK